MSVPLLKYWQLVRLHKWTILLAALLGAIAGNSDHASSDSHLPGGSHDRAPGHESEFPEYEGCGPNLDGGEFLNDTYVRTQLNIVKSRLMLVRVIKKLNLEKRPEFYMPTGSVSAWRKALGLQQPSRYRPRNKHIQRRRRT